MGATQQSSDGIVCQGPHVPRLAASEPQHLTDEALVLSLRTASEPQTVDRLFEEIFHRYHARVVSWCYAVARNRETAMDLAQEVFLKVFRNLHAFRGDSRMSTWIYVIAHNHCLNSIRKRDADPTDSAAQIPPNLEGVNGLEAHACLEKAESFQNIYRAISSILTPMEVRVLWLHYGYDLTLASITHQLLLSNRSGAKAFIVSAKRKLKLYLHNRGITPTALNIGLGANRTSSGGGKQRQAQQYRAFAA
jgi:RNA polymerase sigma-70 factor (ECF subfamily)